MKVGRSVGEAAALGARKVNLSPSSPILSVATIVSYDLTLAIKHRHCGIVLWLSMMNPRTCLAKPGRFIAEISCFHPDWFRQ